ncbi:MAG: amino acid adenylation domain-containing protein [Acidobacteriota bacterium]|nr:amino acid adenylation domain-containing protein [Acidobacteriota bacterium]
MSLRDLYRSLSSLSPEQRALFASRLRESGLAADDIAPRESPGLPVPASPVQQRLWLVDQIEPGDPKYNLPMLCFRLRGRLDTAALTLTFREIERRHESLRTTFIQVDGEPFQVIAPPGELTLPVVDLTGLPAERRERAAYGEVGYSESRRPYDLGKGPLWRLLLLPLGPDDHLLLVGMHHIISDAWSIGVLYREMKSLYAAFVNGRESPLLPLPVQYSDYTLWQRRRLRDEFLAEQLEFWRRQMAGAPAKLELPTDRPRPALRTYHGTRLIFTMPPGLAEGLRGFSQNEGTTLFMTLLSAFDTLLHHYSGQDDVVIGSPVAGRNTVETEKIIGFFVNTLVLRARMGGDPTFRELIARIRDTVLSVYEYQDLPFDRLVEELRPQRDPSYGPLFQVMFSLQNTPIPDPELEGLVIDQEYIDNRTSQCDLILFAGMQQGLLGTLQLEYNTDLFDDATICRMQDHLLTLLEGILRQGAGRHLSELSMLTESERRQLLDVWGGPAAGDRGAGEQLPGVEPNLDCTAYAACLHELFAAQAARSPEAVAVIAPEGSLSYRELARRARLCSRRLRALGVGPEVRTALLAEPSLDMVVGILGILEAGGAYVPLDPSAPAERQSFVIADAAAQIVVADRKLLGSLPPLPGSTFGSVRIVQLGHLGEEEAHPGPLPAAALDSPETLDAVLATLPARAARHPDPRNLAYVIYTSGSTGQPKGVQITHHNVARLFAATRGTFRFGAADVWTLFHSYAFDVSVWEIWGALLHGGTLVIPPRWVAQTPEAFLDLLVDSQVTVLCQTPSAFRQLLQEIAARQRPPELALRTIVFAGEMLEPAMLRGWFERADKAPCTLVNMYGITETTVHTTARVLSRADAFGPPASPIGLPLHDTRLHLLDSACGLVPVGVLGEIHVGGPGLARGYLGRPDLTASRFLPDPFAREGGQRTYRSGDLARRLASGDIEYMGRIDTQVKIRGLRIELGEIEANLCHHPAVLEAAVTVVPDASQEKRIAAYFVARPGQTPGHADLRGFLKAKLPEYMVPAVFCAVESLPLTVNGKLDRTRLPAPDPGRPELDRAFVAPESATEILLAECWTDLLGIEKLGIHDDFFELGGHSLLATRLVSRLRERLKLDLSARLIFHSPTIALMTAAIEEARVKGSTLSEPALVPMARTARRRVVAVREIG